MKTILLCLLALILLVGCTNRTPEPTATVELPTTAAPNNDGFDRQAMLENITNQVILPSHDAFVETLVALETAVQSFTANPTTAVRVEAYVSWNGRSSRLLLDPQVDLLRVERPPILIHIS